MKYIYENCGVRVTVELHTEGKCESTQEDNENAVKLLSIATGTFISMLVKPVCSDSMIYDEYCNTYSYRGVNKDESDG